MCAVEQQKRKRPVGVTVIAVLNIIGAVFLGLIGLAGAGVIVDSGAAAVAGAFVVGISVFTIAVAVGLLRLRNWARITAIVLYAINALLGLIELVFGNPFGLLSMGVALTILIYLNLEHVREAFAGYGQTQRETAASLPSAEAPAEPAGKGGADIRLDTTS